MKSATIPPLCVAPGLREEMEQALDEGGSLVALGEAVVRREVEERRDQAEFVRRGLAAIERSEAAADGIPAEQVIARLEAKLASSRVC